MIGVREDGVKELLAVEDGYRESTDSWAAVMRDLKARGANGPCLVVGDGALGTWAALRDVSPAARRQACWVHAIARVLDTIPKRLQPRAKKLLHEIMEAPTRSDAAQALERFRDEFAAKYPKAVAKLDPTTRPPSGDGGVATIARTHPGLDNTLGAALKWFALHLRIFLHFAPRTLPQRASVQTSLNAGIRAWIDS